MSCFLHLIRLKRGLSPNTFVSLSLTERMGNMLPIAYGGCALALAVQAGFHTLPAGATPFALYSMLGESSRRRVHAKASLI